MPILVFDEKTTLALPALMSNKKEISLPAIEGQSILVSDLDTGEVLLNKGANSDIYAGQATKIMLALAASDNVNLEKQIVAKNWMIEGIGEKIIVPGKSYTGQDLLSPLLLQSSNEAALVLSRFLTAEEFVKRMNAKAKGIGMKNTNFSDVTGNAKENITTLYDVAKMMRYIKDYRKFIMDIGLKQVTAGKNEKNALFRILEMKTKENLSRFIFIGIAESPDAGIDFEKIKLWLNNNFDLQ
jgi:D-alanyl-D-alanine carboxypeptidase